MEERREPSPQFVAAVKGAIQQARDYEDDAVQYLASLEYGIPVYAQFKANQEQARAGGCDNCLYLGLWASSWNGYPNSPHGLVWLFETGIRAQGGNLQQEALRVLLHEFDHALQRDHVLDAMQAKMAAGAWRPSTAPSRGCSRCPGSR